MYFIANWKMFGDLRTLNLLDSVIKFSKNNKNSKFRIVYCPPNTLIRPLSKRLKKTNLEVGAQNCHESSKIRYFWLICHCYTTRIGMFHNNAR